jgi:hypothetical protein
VRSREGLGDGDVELAVVGEGDELRAGGGTDLGACVFGATAGAEGDASFQRARAVGYGLAGTVTVGTTPAFPPAERGRVAETLRNAADDLVVALRDVRPREVYRQLPAEWPLTAGIVLLTLEDPLTLPLLALWTGGASPPTVTRIQACTDRAASTRLSRAVSPADPLVEQHGLCTRLCFGYHSCMP